MKHRRKVYAAMGVVWVGALTALSFLPERDKHALHTRGRLHSPGHFAAFFLSAIILLRVGRRPFGRALVLVVVVLLAFGYEGGQSLLDGYGVEWHDVVVDLLGATLGAVVYALMGGMRDGPGLPRRIISRLRRGPGQAA